MKPFYGTMEHVNFINYKMGNEWGTWTCHACGNQRTGAMVATCVCGAYPKWEYKDSFFVVAKTVIKNQILRVIWKLRSFLTNIERKLSDGDWAV